jgi:tol-pal system protein YbgF
MKMLTRRIVALKSCTSTEVAVLRSLIFTAALLVLGACVTTPEVDPMQVRVDDLDARVGRIDRLVSNQSLMQMTQRLDGLQEEVRTLSGRLEELQNENATLRKQQRDLYADLDNRLKSAPVANPEPTPVDSEQAQYNKAFDALKARNYPVAVDGFRALAAAFPSGQLADNTQYWLGEAYYVTQEYDHAAAAFARVLANWPTSRKAPDALLKLGYTQVEQKRLAVGRATLQQVVAKYPETDAAKLAAERLRKLPADAPQSR